jgi:hypothetical protein
MCDPCYGAQSGHDRLLLTAPLPTVSPFQTPSNSVADVINAIEDHAENVIFYGAV